jgi:hypothetical protein
MCFIWTGLTGLTGLVKGHGVTSVNPENHVNPVYSSNKKAAQSCDNAAMLTYRQDAPG